MAQAFNAALSNKGSSTRSAAVGLRHSPAGPGPQRTPGRTRSLNFGSSLSGRDMRKYRLVTVRTAFGSARGSGTSDLVGRASTPINSDGWKGCRVGPGIRSKPTGRTASRIFNATVNGSATGHSRVPFLHVDRDGFRLGGWVLETTTWPATGDACEGARPAPRIADRGGSGKPGGATTSGKVRARLCCVKSASFGTTRRRRLNYGIAVTGFKGGVAGRTFRERLTSPIPSREIAGHGPIQVHPCRFGACGCR